MITLCCLPMMAIAQKLVVIKGEIDCGKVGYEMPVTARFELRNKGNRKLRITDIETSCGCTKADYPKGEIGAGNTFTVSLTYDARQLGHFEKMVGVRTNHSDKPVWLKMRGVVLADYVDYAKDYPYEIGDLRVDKRDLEFDDVNKGEQPRQEIKIVNAGTKILHPNLMHLPPYLTSTVVPETLSPGKTGRITVTLNSSKLRDFGLLQTAVYLANVPGEKVSSDNEVSVSTVLLPSFAGMDIEQRQYAPQLSLSTDRLEMTFGKKKKMTGEVTLSNRGRTALKISSLQLFTPGLRVTLAKREVAPRETVKMKITGYRDELKGLRTRPRVLMITNDPAMPKVTIEVKMKD